MDVLDHSCSKMGFGGKMCIDGTSKHDEEKDEMYNADDTYDASGNISGKFPEIISVNNSLPANGIPALIIAVKKNRKGHIRELHENISTSLRGIKMILYVEHTVDPNDLPVALWRFCNNLDPKRDNIMSMNKNDNSYSACIGLDGTKKTKEFDNFNRDWPNIIVADDKTIKAIDEKWDQLQIGEFIPSPSLRFKQQLYGENAVSL